MRISRAWEDDTLQQPFELHNGRLQRRVNRKDARTVGSGSRCARMLGRHNMRRVDAIWTPQRPELQIKDAANSSRATAFATCAGCLAKTTEVTGATWTCDYIADIQFDVKSHQPQILKQNVLPIVKVADWTDKVDVVVGQADQHLASQLRGEAWRCCARAWCAACIDQKPSRLGCALAAGKFDSADDKTLTEGLVLAPELANAQLEERLHQHGALLLHKLDEVFQQIVARLV